MRFSSFSSLDCVSFPIMTTSSTIMCRENSLALSIACCLMGRGKVRSNASSSEMKRFSTSSSSRNSSLNVAPSSMTLLSTRMMPSASNTFCLIASRFMKAPDVDLVRFSRRTSLTSPNLKASSNRCRGDGLPRRSGGVLFKLRRCSTGGYAGPQVMA
ncbi:hypothetical protein ALQ32_05024 [Pseudomonas syringae pv. tagetis]|nr:hypothetical protein ALQ32_05024 [Pseudomonas syringae pv. tagetis]